MEAFLEEYFSTNVMVGNIKMYTTPWSHQVLEKFAPNPEKLPWSKTILESQQKKRGKWWADRFLTTTLATKLGEVSVDNVIVEKKISPFFEIRSDILRIHATKEWLIQTRKIGWFSEIGLQESWISPNIWYLCRNGRNLLWLGISLTKKSFFFSIIHLHLVRNLFCKWWPKTESKTQRLSCSNMYFGHIYEIIKYIQKLSEVIFFEYGRNQKILHLSKNNFSFFHNQRLNSVQEIVVAFL